MNPMISPQQELLDILSLTRSFLSMEYKGGELLVADSSTYDFFKRWQPKAGRKQTADKPIAEQQKEIYLPPKDPQKTSEPAPRSDETVKNQSWVAGGHQSPTVERSQLVERPSEEMPTPYQKPVPPSIPAIPTETEPREEPAAIKERHFTLKLEPLTEVKEPDLSLIRMEMTKLFPDRKQLDPLDDALAKRMSQQWKQPAASPEVVILSFQENEEQQLFLQNVKAAINQRLAPCAIYSSLAIETRQAWDKLFLMKELRLIIATDYALYTLPGLMSHYRESPEKVQRYLGGIPLLVLADISLYLKQPQLKAALWQALCKMLPKGSS